HSPIGAYNHREFGSNPTRCHLAARDLKRGKDFLAFNLEQQGDIVSDYYRIRDGYKPRWGNGKRQDLPVYQSFIDQLQSGW
ncbi:MAG: hypothetical protein AAFP19_14455, partial [Bacteroidota bacterium]